MVVIQIGTFGSCKRLQSVCYTNGNRKLPNTNSPSMYVCSLLSGRQQFSSFTAIMWLWDTSIEHITHTFCFRTRHNDLADEAVQGLQSRVHISFSFYLLPLANINYTCGTNLTNIIPPTDILFKHNMAQCQIPIYLSVPRNSQSTGRIFFFLEFAIDHVRWAIGTYVVNWTLPYFSDIYIVDRYSFHFWMEFFQQQQQKENCDNKWNSINEFDSYWEFRFK